MRISQLAERSGVPATTLRVYEGAGLLSVGRTPAGYRMYGEDAVERLGFIGACRVRRQYTVRRRRHLVGIATGAPAAPPRWRFPVVRDVRSLVVAGGHRDEEGGDAPWHPAGGSSSESADHC